MALISERIAKIARPSICHFFAAIIHKKVCRIALNFSNNSVFMAKTGYIFVTLQRKKMEIE